MQKRKRVYLVRTTTNKMVVIKDALCKRDFIYTHTHTVYRKERTSTERYLICNKLIHKTASHEFSLGIS